jgi:O-Antigen ligase
VTVFALDRDVTRERVASLPARVAPVFVVVAAIVALGAADGGYFPTSWGWSALLFSWTALLAVLVRRRTALSRLEIAYIGFLLALLAWTALSLVWTSTVTQTMYETERTLSYVAFAAALALVAQRRHVPSILAGVLVALTGLSAYALATRLLPGGLTRFDPVTSYRLSEPLGYWNALGALSSFGCILALGFATRAQRVVLRGLASASLVFLVPTLYFTFSRGGWLALSLGVATLITIEPQRLRFVTHGLAIAPWPALALWRAFESKGLTTDYSPLGQASSDGERLAWTLLLLALTSFVATVAFASLAARVSVRPKVRQMWAVALLAAALVTAGAGIAAAGGPSEAATRALHSIRKPSPNVHGDQTQRLFSLSANGRLQTWSAALDDASAHPLLGSGAGTFEVWWLEHRTLLLNVRDAHSLHLETLAELGASGLLLLLVATSLPLFAARRARSFPFVPAALAAYVAFLGHAAVDWDWEMPAVTICGLTFAGCVLIAARSYERLAVVSATPRLLVIGAQLIASVFAFVANTGNRALGEAERASQRADSAAVARHARTAARWMPWSSEPAALEADAALEQGDRIRARRLYAKALADDPRKWELWLKLALASNGRARMDALTRAAQLNPLDPEIAQLAGPGVRE